jgi:hypothetical protein
MVYFRTVNHNFGTFWSAFELKMLVYFMAPAIFLVYFVAIWYILGPFGTFAIVWHIFPSFCT